MPTLAEVSAKVTELQTALDEEQVQIAAAIEALQTTVTDLEALVAAGGTEADRQAIVDQLNATIADLQATVAP